MTDDDGCAVGIAGLADAAPATDRTIVSTDLWYYLRIVLESALALPATTQTIPSMTR